MGLFFKTVKNKEYIHLDRRKHTSSFWNLAIILAFIVFPIMFLIMRNNIIIVGVLSVIFILLILGAWIGIEGILYGFVIPGIYQFRGKKVVREIGKGIKIYN